MENINFFKDILVYFLIRKLFNRNIIVPIYLKIIDLKNIYIKSFCILTNNTIFPAVKEIIRPMGDKSNIYVFNIGSVHKMF